MAKMTLTVPIVKVDKWSRWEDKGSLEVVGEFDVLTTGYTTLKAEVNELLQQAGSEVMTLTELKQVEAKVSDAKSRLADLERDIKRAETYKSRLLAFLGRLGIDGSEYMDDLYINNQPILEGEARPVDDDEEDED